MFETYEKLQKLTKSERDTHFWRTSQDEDICTSAACKLRKGCRIIMCISYSTRAHHKSNIACSPKFYTLEYHKSSCMNLIRLGAIVNGIAGSFKPPEKESNTVLTGSACHAEPDLSCRMLEMYERRRKISLKERRVPWSSARRYRSCFH